MKRIPTCPLTEAQLQLLQAWVDHRAESDDELAAVLHISRHTVHTHFKNIFEIMQVRSRSLALAIAIGEGWVAPPTITGRKIPQKGYGLAGYSSIYLAQEAKLRVDLEGETRERRTMGMTVNYTVINGQVISEDRGGVIRNYISDSSGNTVALTDDTGTITDTFEYWPYGEEQNRTGTTPTPFRYGGAKGQYRDSASRVYAGNRMLDTRTGRWMAMDPLERLSPQQNSYIYAGNNPMNAITATGLQKPGNPGPKPPPRCRCGCKNPCSCGTVPPSPLPTPPKRKPKRGECWYDCPPGKPQTFLGQVTKCIYSGCVLRSGPPEICPATINLTVPNTNLISIPFDELCRGGRFPWLDP